MQLQPPRRPGSIKTLGILNVAFAGMGVLGLGMTYALYFGDLKIGHRNPVVEIAHSSPEYMSFLRWSLVSGALGIVLLAMSGIGLLKFKTWARKVSIGYAIFGIVNAIAGFIATQHYLMAALSKSSDPAQKAGMIGGTMGGIVGVVYPLILLIFMMKKDVREAFEHAAEPPIPPARTQ
jgi:hypothetical protein